MSSSKPLTTWQPLDIFSPDRINHKAFAIVILNQELKLPSYLYRQLWANASYIVAADGGANRLYNLNKTHQSKTCATFFVDAIIGDLDSLLPEVRSHFSSMNIPIIEDPDQYSTDFTKAVKHIRSEPSRQNIDIVVLGGLGGRVDQGLSVVHHLYLFQDKEGYTDGRMYLLSSEALTFVLNVGKHEIKAKQAWFDIGSGVNNDCKQGNLAFGKHVGILPMKGESIISTKGLEWDVQDWKTVFGGLVSTSNHVKEEIVEVETSEDVIFTIDFDFEI